MPPTEKVSITARVGLGIGLLLATCSASESNLVAPPPCPAVEPLNKNIAPDSVMLGLIPDINIPPEGLPSDEINKMLDQKVNEWETAFSRPQIVQIYEGFYEEKVPLGLLKHIHELGAIPMINFEPRNKKPSDKNIIFNPFYEFKNIGQDEEFLRQKAREWKSLGWPVAVRFAFEMNLPFLPQCGGFPLYGTSPDNPPEDFVNAWIFFDNIIHEEGAENVFLVFSPNVIKPEEEAFLKRFCPPPQNVDLVSTDIYDRHSINPFSYNYYNPDLSFEDLFGPTLSVFKQMFPGIAIHLTESGSLREPEYRGQEYSEFIDEAVAGGLKSVSYFNIKKPGLCDGDWKISDKPQVAACVKPHFDQQAFTKTNDLETITELLQNQIGRSLKVTQ